MEKENQLACSFDMAIKEVLCCVWQSWWHECCCISALIACCSLSLLSMHT